MNPAPDAEAFIQAVEAGAALPNVPALPVENSIVGAALAARDARQQVEVLAFLLSTMPRDATSIWSTIASLESAAAEVRQHYAAYHEILSCKGTA